MTNKLKRILPYLLMAGLVALAVLYFADTAFAAKNFGLDAATPSALPKTKIPNIIANVIKAALSLVGVVFLILMLYAGFLWMTARGNNEQVTKAKDMITSAIIGIVIVASAYAITSFVITGIISGGKTTPPSSMIENVYELAGVNAANAQADLGGAALKTVGKEAFKDAGTENAGDKLPQTIGSLIKTFISLLGIIFLILIVYGGWLWMTARGEAERVEKAKSTITRAMIGVVIVVSAYAITGFVISSVIK